MSGRNLPHPAFGHPLLRLPPPPLAGGGQGVGEAASEADHGTVSPTSALTPSPSPGGRGVIAGPPLEKGGTGRIASPVQFPSPSGRGAGVRAAVRARKRARVIYSLLVGLVLVLTGCSSVPFKETELVPVTPSTSAVLAEGVWTTKVGTVLIRQSAVFELLGMKFPVTGLMKLDASAGTARLVGMNDMGVKLYDISIDRTSSRANYIIPELSRYPGFADAVSVSVRRIFLEPEPTGSDILTRNDDSYQLARQSSDGKTSFIFGGADHQLLEKSYSGKEMWHVRYYQYGRLNDMLVPGGIVLEDDRAGYRLTLWTESVEKADE
jgi:hypothetical protein